MCVFIKEQTNKQTKTKKTVKEKNYEIHAHKSAGLMYFYIIHFTYVFLITVTDQKLFFNVKTMGAKESGVGGLKREKKKKCVLITDLIRTYFSAQQAQLCPQ